MRVNKNQLEALIRESVQEEIESLNEEELQELLGGLKGLAGGAANVARRAGSAVAGAGRAAGAAVGGAARKAGGAVAGAAGAAAGAVKGAYQEGEKQQAISTVKKSIQGVVTAIDQAMQKIGNDPNMQNDLENVKAAVTSAQQVFAESKNLRTLRKKTK
jgi:hypothetical protein